MRRETRRTERNRRADERLHGTGAVSVPPRRKSGRTRSTGGNSRGSLGDFIEDLFDAFFD